MQCRVCAEFVPIKAIVVDEGGDVLESLKCDGMCDCGVWGVGVKAFPFAAIVANKVGDRAEDLVWYDGGHGVLRRRRGADDFLWEGGSICEDGERKRGRRCEVGFGDGYCFEGGYRVNNRVSVQSVVFLLSHLIFSHM